MDEAKLEQRVKELEFEIAKYEAAFNNAGIDFFDINFATGEASQSENIASSMGYSPEDLDTFEKRNATFNPSDLQESLPYVEKLRKGEIDKTDLLFRIYGKNGDLFWVKHDGLIIEDPITKEPHFIGALRNVTKEHMYLENLRQLANQDSLTNTLNRRSGLHKLEKDMKDKTEIIATYVDINDFKSVNDTLGHKAGDRVLKTFSKVILGLLPESSYLIRLGGDEFLVIFVGQKIDNVYAILKDMNNKLQCEEAPANVSFSYGCCIYNSEVHQSVDELIHDADTIMYKYKKNKQ